MATQAQLEAQNKARLANDPNAYLAAGGALSNGAIPQLLAPTGQENVQLSPGSSIYNINSDIFRPTPTTPFETPAPLTQVPSFGLTDPEKKESETLTRLQEIENILAGKSTYEEEQKKAFDISGKKAISQSLYNQINALKAETEAIPLELERGAGGTVTREILGRKQRELMSQNAEKALILNASYNASIGDLALAESNVQDAVRSKFGAYEAEKAAKLNNLGYIKSSPEYSVADKNRALQQEEAIKARDAEVKQVQDIYKSVAKLAADAAASAGVDSLSLKKIQDLATSIGSDTGVDEAKAIMSEAEQIAAPFMREEITADSEGAIISLISEGITNPVDIYNVLSKNKIPVNFKAITDITAELRQQKILTESPGAVLSPDNKIILSSTDAQKINKEIATTDEFKSIRKGQDSLQYLLDFEETFKKTGLETLPGAAKSALKTKYQTTLLNLKEFFNLGVLNGPDIYVLQGILPDPTSGVFKKFRGRASGVSEGIESLKQNISKTLDERYTSLARRYGDYSPQSVAALADLNRLYVDQKIMMDPKVKKMVDENPNFTDEDIIQIIQTQ